jgi:hypothetical protein
MTKLDLSTFEYSDLLTLRADIDARLEELRSMHGAQLLARFDEEAQQFGLTAAELVSGRRPRRRSRKDNGSRDEDAA